MRSVASNNRLRIGALVLGACLSVGACGTKTVATGERSPAPSPDPVAKAEAPTSQPTDSRPGLDDAPGNRIRVMFSAPCPTDDSAAVGVENPGAPDLDRMLVPPGKPTGGRLCKYGQQGEPPTGAAAAAHALTRNLLLNSATAGRLAADVAQLSLAHAAGGPTHCPADSVTVIVLAYPGRPDVDLWQTDGGCTYLANGHIRANGGLSDATLWAPPSPSP